jgi:hypothetical protein
MVLSEGISLPVRHVQQVTYTKHPSCCELWQQLELILAGVLDQRLAIAYNRTVQAYQKNMS